MGLNECRNKGIDPVRCNTSYGWWNTVFDDSIRRQYKILRVSLRLLVAPSSQRPALVPLPLSPSPRLGPLRRLPHSTMQLRVPFSFLFAELLLVLAHVEATPAKRSFDLVTLPLKRSPRPADIHPAAVSAILDAPRLITVSIPSSPALPTAYQPRPPPSLADERPGRPF